MPQKISPRDIEKSLQKLLSSEEGILTILSGTLAISDFDDPKEAIAEALKTFNGNRAYFNKIINRWRSDLRSNDSV